MIKGIPIDITLRDNETGEYLRIPVVPPSIAYTPGAAMPNTVKILNLGNVTFPNGVDLDSMTWASFFPAKYDPGYCATSELLEPQAYRDKIKGWKNAGTILQLIIPAAGVNKAMRVNTFTWDLRGHEGDIYYNLGLKEAKTIRPKKVKVGDVIKTAGTQEAGDRTAAPGTQKPKTHTVQAGDTLTRIAKQYSIEDWRKDLYEPNKSVIGVDPNKIIVGQVLKL